MHASERPPPLAQGELLLPGGGANRIKINMPYGHLSQFTRVNFCKFGPPVLTGSIGRLPISVASAQAVDSRQRWPRPSLAFSLSDGSTRLQSERA